MLFLLFSCTLRLFLSLALCLSLVFVASLSFLSFSLPFSLSSLSLSHE